ncbi:hypothetical protein [Nitrosophilus kaiyonis]|uniref:hypothetical protein n=1 Tax=Nitrosophilus kaiyonis TaxID=2930200 RepID=UPI002491513F|nr:hypothetical protein [Nitrosophilus kaiyonis]
MNESEFYNLKEQVSNHKIFIEQQLEKIDIKINHLEEKISDIKNDIGDMKAILKELENLKIDVGNLIRDNRNVDYIIDKKINDFKKELEEKKYKDWRLWTAVGGAVGGFLFGVISLIISIYK